jgi:membrane-bound lytic murein transglycosylase D
MYETTRTQALAIALILAPVLGHAADSAPSPIATGNSSTATTLVKASPSQSLSPARADDYKDPDLWSRIRSGYAIPDVDNTLVAKHAQWYASRPDYLARTSGRASLYLYHVVQELEKRACRPNWRCCR